MTFTEYKVDPKSTRTRSYKGVCLTANQLFITMLTSKEFVKDYTHALVSFDRDKKAIKLRLTKRKYNSALEIRHGLSYARYISCRLHTQAKMPKGRYYLESDKKADDKSSDLELIFKQ